MTITADYDLTRHNTFGVKAVCSRYVETSTTAETQAFVRGRQRGQRLIVLGGGSNMLFPPVVDATVLHPAIGGIETAVDGETVTVSCGAGERWDDVVALCVERGYYGAENLSGIPGSVGATAVQNIGAYGAEAKDIICSVEAVDTSTGDVVTLSPADCRYGYRSSRFKDEWRGRYVVTHVSYRLSSIFRPLLGYGNLRDALGGACPTAAAVRRAVVAMRAAKLPDPAKEGNAGSFFMNPVVSAEVFCRLAEAYPAVPHYAAPDGIKLSAGWLIEQCGWKGRTLGRAGVHDRQALVLVNRGGATADDILRLMHAIHDDVGQRFGIELRPEVVIV